MKGKGLGHQTESEAMECGVFACQATHLTVIPADLAHNRSCGRVVLRRYDTSLRGHEAAWLPYFVD